jgi:hypothetical protein
MLLGPLFPADMLGLKGELRRCGQRMLSWNLAVLIDRC